MSDHYCCKQCGMRFEDCDCQLAPASADDPGHFASPHQTQDTANSMQVGGGHYKAEYEHWDLVADLGMNYYQGNASKYITRAYKKNGRQDLEKAIHYMQKAVELQRAGRLDEPDDDADFDIILRFMTANNLTPAQGEIIWKIYHGEWYTAIDLTRKLLVQVPDEGAEAKLLFDRNVPDGQPSKKDAALVESHEWLLEEMVDVSRRLKSCPPNNLRGGLTYRKQRVEQLLNIIEGALFADTVKG